MNLDFLHSQKLCNTFVQLCKENNLSEIISRLRKSPESLNAQEDRHGLTLLANAVIYSQVEIVRFLLEKGADPNIQDYSGEGPLHLAADNSDAEITEALLHYKADPNLATVDGETPLHHAAFKGDKKIIHLLLTHGANPNFCDTILGRTPLHCAVQCDHFECVKLLLAHGADPNIEDKENISPLTTCQDPEIKKILMELMQTPKSRFLQIIPEVEEEEKNIRNTLSISSVSFSITNSSFESLPSEVLPTQRFGSEDTTTSFQVNSSPEDVRLLKFLKALKLQSYKEILTKAGFDDLEMMTYQMNSPLPITHSMLETIGISKHGHRSRLLMKLEQNSGGCVIGKIEEKSTIEAGWECCQVKRNAPLGIHSLSDWLTLIKLEKYLKIFEQAGYEDIDFMYSQMNSKYPIDDLLLQKIGITKPGHRLRILAKLLEDSQSNYIKNDVIRETCRLL